MTVWQVENKTLYPSIYRICIGLLLLVNTIFLFPDLTEFFNQPNFQYKHKLSLIRTNIYPFFIVYGILLILFIFGIGKRFISIFVFICTFTIYLLKDYTVDWGNTILYFSLCYFMLIDSFRYFSLAPSKLVNYDVLSKIGISMMQIHLIYIYMVNGIQKLFSSDWTDGIAVGIFIKSSEIFDSLNIGDFILQFPILIYIFSYVVLIFQNTFFVLLFNIPKWLKYGVLILGICIHISMGFFLRAWQFEFSVLLLYGFFLTDTEIKTLFKKIARKK